MGVLILVRSFADALLFESIKILDAISKASERQCKSDGGHGHMKVHAKLVVSIRSAREVGSGKKGHGDEESPPQKHEDGMDFHLVSIRCHRLLWYFSEFRSLTFITCMCFA